MATASVYEQEKAQYLQRIERTSEIGNKILQNQSLNLASNKQLAQIQDILDRNNKFKHKLESNEFEIAIYFSGRC